MRERIVRILAASAIGLAVGIVSYLLGVEFGRLATNPNSTRINDVIVGLFAGLAAYGWASFIAEKHSRQSSAERLRQEGASRERTRIACELHDTLAQGFAGMIVNLEAAGEFLSECPRAQEFSDRALRIGRESLAEARSLLQNLRESEPERADLSEGVQRLVERLTENTTLRTSCVVEGIQGLSSAETEGEILRIIREAVQNVVRHADASELRIAIRGGDDQIELCVEDDGCGFAVGDPTTEEGFGLISMRERAQNMGGLLWLYSRVGQGTQVVAFIPISKRGKEEISHAREGSHSGSHR
ncbi:MAG TPA: sensor histidine kinase [Verrucomicrobiae bacterium]|nr:sensor histidine kinase [Verrucomicrobiae bacterium]